MSICQAPLRVSWGDRVSSSVMKLWQMDAGRFPIQPVRTLCPDYEAGTLSGNTHTHISKLSECTQIAIGELTWMELCLNFADYTSFLYPSSHSVWCYFVSERASQSPGEARRARNCMSLNEPASGKFLLIHQPMLGNEGEAEGQTHSTLSAILLSLLIIQGNYSYMPHSLHAPSLQRVPFSFFQPLHATLMPPELIIGKLECGASVGDVNSSGVCQVSGTWLDRQWQQRRPVHPGPRFIINGGYNCKARAW